MNTTFCMISAQTPLCAGSSLLKMFGVVAIGMSPFYLQPKSSSWSMYKHNLFTSMNTTCCMISAQKQHMLCLCRQFTAEDVCSGSNRDAGHPSINSSNCLSDTQVCTDRDAGCTYCWLVAALWQDALHILGWGSFIDPHAVHCTRMLGRLKRLSWLCSVRSKERLSMSTIRVCLCCCVIG